MAIGGSVSRSADWCVDVWTGGWTDGLSIAGSASGQVDLRAGEFCRWASRSAGRQVSRQGIRSVILSPGGSAGGRRADDERVRLKAGWRDNGRNVGLVGVSAGIRASGLTGDPLTYWQSNWWMGERVGMHA